MNGVQHYTEAERLLRAATDDVSEWDSSTGTIVPTGVRNVQDDDARQWVANTIAAAQVSATLALADMVASLVDRLGAVT